MRTRATILILRLVEINGDFLSKRRPGYNTTHLSFHTRRQNRHEKNHLVITPAFDGVVLHLEFDGPVR